MLGEPAPTPYDLNFSLFGIPVRVAPWFWLVALILGYQPKDPGGLVSWVVALFVSILVHELGHAAVMRAYRFRPWIVLYGMGGLTCRDQGYAYRSKGNEPLGQTFISLAGPAAGFLLAGILLLVLMAAGYGKHIGFGAPLGVTPHVSMSNLRVAVLLNQLFFISVAWGLVNLLPIYPLDGGQIAREIFLKLNPRDGIRLSLILSIVAAVAMAIFGYVQWEDKYAALLFAYFAFTSYAALQSYQGRGLW
jgi:stage IV sporulation protein FB